MTERGYVLSNLDFEYQWAGHSVPKAVKSVGRRWRCILKLLRPGARAVDPIHLDDSIQRGLPFLPWGWTPGVLAIARKRELHYSAPPLEVIRRVNSKVFSHNVEKELCIELFGARLVETTAELSRALADIDGPWIAKHPWGVSGRRQRRGRKGELDEASLQWARRALRQTPLVVEPRIRITGEFSVHFDVDHRGGVERVGHCTLLTDKTGTFRGLVVDGETPPEAIIDGAKTAARHVADQGYFGPLGIDSMIGSWNGRSLVRPLTEINARHTFGRLAIELGTRLEGPAGPLIWHHPPGGDSAPTELRPWPKRRQPGLFRLPDDVDPKGASRTHVEIPPDL